jgi:hypothetical protein
MSATLEKARDLIKANGPKESTPLRWKRLNEHSLISECGIFLIGKVVVDGRTFYEVWGRGPDHPRRPALCLRQNLPDGQSAKDWASSFALSYRNGTVSLKAPLTKVEIEEARRCGEASK